jgi:isopenicillin N synthase-like dioxygenase
MTMPDDELVQTVDLSAWFGDDAEASAAVVAAVDAQCRRLGFLRITGHGIPDELVQRMLHVTSAFFDLPEAEKQSYVLDDKARNRGYASYGSEALAYSLGVDAKPDMFEAFNVGVEVADYADPYYAAEAHRMFASNVWPERPEAMRPVWLEYFNACKGLSEVLMRIFALGLRMPEDYLVERTGKAPSVMRANNYQRRDGHAEPEVGQMRMGAHSDYGACTILLADRVPGLQIVGPDGHWHDVLPEPGTLLVNLGDLLAEWTNDRWRSTLHRVVPPPAGTEGAMRRRSIAYFHEADYDALVTVMPTCVSADEPAKYEPVTAGDHLMNKLMGPRTLQKSAADQTALGERVAAVAGPGGH